MQIGDKTRRLLKYDSRTKQVTVFLRGLSFSNAVALKKDKDFVIVIEKLLPKSQDIGSEVKNLKPVTLLHNLLDVPIIFKETVMVICWWHKIIVEYQNSKCKTREIPISRKRVKL